MGLGSIFGSIGKGLLKVGKYSGVPGVSQAATIADDVLGGIGEVAGGMAKGRADGRAAESNAIISRDQQRLQDILAQRSQDTQMASMNLEAPQTRMAQAIRGGIISSGMPNFSMQAPPGVNKPQMTGMMGMGSISPASRQGGADMERQALLKMLSGETVPERGFTPSELPQAGLFDKILGVTSAVGGFGSALGKRTPGAPGSTPPVMTQTSAPPKRPAYTGTHA